MSDFECIELNDVDDVSVVKFTDEKVVDPARIEKMGSELLSLTGQDEHQKVLLNFENVRFFSSAAINKLIVLEKRMRSQGGKLRLSNLRPEVKDLFSFTNLDGLFKISDGESDAMNTFED
ncbi:MAG: STAS domain-containing protein [Planctomycetota bacterium]